MQGALDRLREIAAMPEADLMVLKPSEIAVLLNRARRLAREASIILEDTRQTHEKLEVEPAMRSRLGLPAFDIPDRPPKSTELFVHEQQHYHD